MEFNVNATDYVSYAMANNGISPIYSVDIEGVPDESDSFEISIELLDRGRRLSAPFSRTAWASSDGSIALTNIDLRLDPASMSSIEEQRAATLRINIANSRGELESHDSAIVVLAANQWLLDLRRTTRSLELLPAFVMPHDPAVAKLVDEARARLETTTGRGSTEGYQSGPERVDDVVHALLESAQARGIRYSMPPASWADRGQKVRTPSEVLEGRAGTCLDTTLLMAAALEHVGINCLVFVAEGHVFLGYWRDDRNLPTIVEQDLSGTRNLIDLGLIALIEATAITDSGNSSGSFARAAADTRSSYLSGDLSRAIAAVDIKSARQDRIIPLPAHQTDNGVVQIVVYEPSQQAHTFVPLPPAELARRTSPVPQSAPPRIEQWKNALLDLSMRNRLINFPTNGRTSISLAVPDGALGAVEDALNAGSVLSLRSSDAISELNKDRGIRFGSQLPQQELAEVFSEQSSLFTDLSTDAYLTRLRNLDYKARTVVEETGANNLYLALGSLHWELDGRKLKSPLILVPIVLSGSRHSAFRIKLDEAGSSTPNYCLVEKLRTSLGIEIPELENPVEDASGIDLPATIRGVQRSIAEGGFPFHVEETADIAILQFAKFRLWKDLSEHWERMLEAPLVKHLALSPTEEFIDPAHSQEVDLDELDAQCPIPADSSQLKAIAAAVNGNTFVLEGPPGTGKSQTITNLLARALVAGKKVMFVAEKRAALQVVSDRLNAVGLGAFSLDLHDKASRPNEVRAQIKHALDLSVSANGKAASAKLDEQKASRRPLARYRTSLHELNNAQLSMYSAHADRLLLSDLRNSLPIPAEWVANADGTQLATLQAITNSIDDVAAPARPRAHHPWGFIFHPPAAQVSPESILLASERLSAAFAEISRDTNVASYTGALLDPAELQSATAFVAGPDVSLPELDEVRSPQWRRSKDEYLSALGAFCASPQPGITQAAPTALDLPLGAIRADIASAASTSFFGRKTRMVTAFAPLAAHLRSGQKIRPKQMLSFVDQLLQTRIAADQFAPGRSGIPGLRTPDAWNPWHATSIDHLNQQIAWLEWASKIIDPEDPPRRTFAEATRTYYVSRSSSSPAEIAAINELGAASENLWTLVGATPNDVQEWLDGQSLSAAWQSTSGGRQQAGLQGLNRWLALVDRVQPFFDAGLSDAARALLKGDVDAADAARAFRRGIAEASIIERQLATALDEFDALAHQKHLGRFASSSDELRGLQTSTIPTDVLTHRKVDAVAARGQVGRLRREVERKRGGLKVRGLIEQFGDLIIDVMPCVLLSPESAARFFPVDPDLFDLVVFDEASQIRVADAIGVLGRAKSAVIVGDSKQMPPTSFAEPGESLDDDALLKELAPEPDEESILAEAVQARVERQRLTWHYRSKNELLIAFSNNAYYDNELSSFPSPSRGSTESGLRLVRLDGAFLRNAKGKALRTNPVEAQAIVDEIARRFRASTAAAPSIGVVTFNHQQRTLIEDMLRDLNDDRILDALDGVNGEGLFVKNLENVQGDERDVILFSTAFSKNESGILPLNFGPLSRPGGERRLNVAITRARHLVIVYSSFSPSDLRVEDTSSVGIKHLRAYLELADAGSEAAQARAQDNRDLDPHRDDVAEALRERSLTVATDVGLSDFTIDLAIADPNDSERLVLAVLLDGPGWARRPTVGDRDRLPIEVLNRNMGWPGVERIWLPEWLADRDSVIDRLEQALQEAAKRSGEPQAPTKAEPQQLAVPLANSVNIAEPPSRVLRYAQPFKPWNPTRIRSRSHLDRLPDRNAVAEVRSVIDEVLMAESPVSLNRLARLTAGAFDLTRMNQARIDSIVQLVPIAQRDEFGFAWPATADPTTFRLIRTASEDDPRRLDEVHPFELVTAIVSVTEAAGGIFEDELLSEVIGVFGWKRRTDAAIAPVQLALSMALEQRRVAKLGSGLIDLA